MGEARRRRGENYRARYKPRPPIVLATCQEKYVYYQFWPNLLKIQRQDTDIIITRGQARTDLARNELVNSFLETKATHILFLDSDQVFPPYTIDRLLSHKKPVVGCLYFHRQKPFRPHAYKWNWEVLTPLGEPTITALEITAEDQGLLKVDAIGTGGLMVAREVFGIVKPPWFEYGGQWDSEDITFCRKLAEERIEIWCDTGCESGHLAEFVIGRQNYLLEKSIRDGTTEIPKGVSRE